MNEEFGVLKDMVPACAGQDMHKLQVLSASIEYMKYLQQCLADLRAVHARCPPQPSPVSPFKSRDVERGNTLVEEDGEEDEDEDEDEDMMDADEATVLTPAQHQRQHQHQRGYSSSQHPSVSPAILPNNHMTPSLLPSTHTSPAVSSSQIRAVTYSYTPTFGGSALPSPVYDSRPTSSATVGAGGHHSGFKLTSPALRPQNQNQEGADNGQSADRTPTEKDDHEATTALLMLNTDRRSWSGPSGGNGSGQGSAGGGNASTRGDGGRGMSVRDLLSG
jgi:hypothetical protein